MARTQEELPRHGQAFLGTVDEMKMIVVDVKSVYEKLPDLFLIDDIQPHLMNCQKMQKLQIGCVQPQRLLQDLLTLAVRKKLNPVLCSNSGLENLEAGTLNGWSRDLH